MSSIKDEDVVFTNCVVIVIVAVAYTYVSIARRLVEQLCLDVAGNVWRSYFLLGAVRGES